MKLLFDENLSFRLVALLDDIFPFSTHASSVGLASAMDDEIWSFAQTFDYVIVTKDADFHERSLIKGFPPKIVWIRRGNCRTEQIARLIRSNVARLEELASDQDAGWLVLQ